MSTSNAPPLEDKTDFVFDIHIMKSILHSIHSTDLIHRQPTEVQRTAYADAVSLLEKQLAKTETHLEKRQSCGKRLQRFLSCKDKDYNKFMKLTNELREIYSALLLNAIPTPPQATTPGPSLGSSSSGSSGSSDQGLWMGGAQKRCEAADLEEQIENALPELRLVTATPSPSNSAKSSDSSNIKGNRVNLSRDERERLGYR